MEYKEKLKQMNLTITAEKCDFQIALASETVVNPVVTSFPFPVGACYHAPGQGTTLVLEKIWEHCVAN